MSEFSEGTVNLPVAGKIKKSYVLIPAAVAAVYVGYRWYQNRQAAAANTTSDGTYSTPDLTDYGLSTTGGATNITGNTGSTVTDGTNPNAIDTNAAWTNKAVELLGNAGYDQATVYNALGEFLARRALDKTEATIARAAIAAVGQPPVGGPFSVLEEASTDSGTLAAPANLRAWNTPLDTQIGMQWDPVPGALHYNIYRTDISNEAIGDSTDTKFWAKGLQPNHQYGFYVRAISTTNKVGAQSSTYTAKTAGVKLAKPSTPTASAVTRSSFRATVPAVKGATYYRWMQDGRDMSPTDKPYRDFVGLKANTSHKIKVQADTSYSSPGPWSNELSVRTKK